MGSGENGVGSGSGIVGVRGMGPLAFFGKRRRQEGKGGGKFGGGKKMVKKREKELVGRGKGVEKREWII